jgi:hypothetical protein
MYADLHNPTDPQDYCADTKGLNLKIHKKSQAHFEKHAAHRADSCRNKIRLWKPESMINNNEPSYKFNYENIFLAEN